MAYITNAKAKSILFKTELKNLRLSGNVYKKTIHFLSHFEKNQILAFKELIGNTEKFFQEIYKPIELYQDTYTYVYERDGQQPSYHIDKNCRFLNQDYEDFSIPPSIRKNKDGTLNMAKIHEFRMWFQTVEYLYKGDIEAFVFRLNSKFRVTERPESFKKDNSGYQEFVNYSIQDLEAEIDLIIEKEKELYTQSPRHQIILKQFRKYSYLWKKKIKSNRTGYSIEEVKEVLESYHKTIKLPIMTVLTEYNRSKFNKDLEFEVKILDRLNFKPYSHCYKEKKKTKDKLDQKKGQFIDVNHQVRNNYPTEDEWQEYINIRYSNN